jgi:2-C-methyl-D-erythritol 2,4-cyclodiphosphate synthase
MLVLGGVEIPNAAMHLVGHSDADVLLHAVTDAILGGAGLPDIGELFPNTAAVNKDRDSAEMLRLAAGRVADAGWNIVNIDCVIMAEAPKLSPHKPAMRERIASLLDMDANAVGLKSKTGEGFGPVGRGEAIDVRCVALLNDHSTLSN